MIRRRGEIAACNENRWEAEKAGPEKGRPFCIVSGMKRWGCLFPDAKGPHLRAFICAVRNRLYDRMCRIRPISSYSACSALASAAASRPCSR